MSRGSPELTAARKEEIIAASAGRCHGTEQAGERKRKTCLVYKQSENLEGEAEAPAVRDEARRKPNEQQSAASGMRSRATIVN